MLAAFAWLPGVAADQDIFTFATLLLIDNVLIVGLRSTQITQESGVAKATQETN